MAEGLASFPQETMLADRRSAIEGFGLSLEEGLAREAEIGGAVTGVGVEGATRFAAGEGRGGKGAGLVRFRAIDPHIRGQPFEIDFSTARRISTARLDSNTTWA